MNAQNIKATWLAVSLSDVDEKFSEATGQAWRLLLLADFLNKLVTTGNIPDWYSDQSPWVDDDFTEVVIYVPDASSKVAIQLFW